MPTAAKLESREVGHPCESLGTSPFTPCSSGPPDPGSGPEVEKLALYQGEVVLARQNNILGGHLPSRADR